MAVCLSIVYSPHPLSQDNERGAPQQMRSEVKRR